MRYKLSTTTHHVHLRRESYMYSDEFNSLTCPFSMNLEPRPTPCGESCPHFEIEEPKPGLIRVTLSCVPCRKLIAIEPDPKGD